MPEGNFSNRVQDVIRLSREEAIRLGHDYIGTEHLLLGIIREGEGIAVKILRNLGADLYKIKKAIEDTVRSSGATLTIGNIPLTKQAEKVLKITYLEAKLYKSDVIGTEHLLLSLLRDEDNIAAQILNQFNVTYDGVRAELDNIISGRPSTPPKSVAAGATDKKPERTKTPVLDNFGRDLTKLAADDKLDPIVGREKEIERVSQVLSRRKHAKRNIQEIRARLKLAERLEARQLTVVPQVDNVRTRHRVTGFELNLCSGVESILRSKVAH